MARSRREAIAVGIAIVFAGIILTSITIYVVTNPLTVGHTDGTSFLIEGIERWNNPAAVSVTYGGTFDASLTYTKTGSITGDYTLWFSTDGALTWTVITRAGNYTWQFSGDWSTWTHVQLRSTTDPLLIGSTQNM